MCVCIGGGGWGSYQYCLACFARSLSTAIDSFSVELPSADLFNVLVHFSTLHFLFLCCGMRMPTSGWGQIHLTGITNFLERLMV